MRLITTMGLFYLLCGLYGLFSSSSNFILLLLFLEFMVLGCFMLLMSKGLMVQSLFTLFAFVVLSVCVSSLGLSLLVKSSMVSSNAHVSS